MRPGPAFFRHQFLPDFCWGHNFVCSFALARLQRFVDCLNSVTFNEFLRLKIVWSNHVGLFFDASELTKLAFKRDLLFGPVDNRFRQRYKAVVFDLFHKLPVRELSFGQKRCAQFLDV